jgi:hypothetical protein
MKSAIITNQNIKIKPENASFRISHSSYQQKSSSMLLAETQKRNLKWNESISIKGPQPQKSFQFYPDGPIGNYQGL